MKRKFTWSTLLMPAVLAAVLILPHPLFFNNAYLDIEPLYVDSALRIATDGFGADLSAYYEIDANPILTSLIFAAAYKLFGESPVVSRLTIFLLSFAFVFFLFYYIKPKMGSLISFLAALLLAVNPMFITYSQYVASDLDFMMFSSIAFFLLIFPRPSSAQLASSIWFGISLATKYAVVVLAPVVFLISVLRSQILTQFSREKLVSLVRFNAWYFLLAIIVALPVILVVFHFQNSLLPLREVPISLSAVWFLPRFFAYLLWLGLFIGPSSLILAVSLWRRIGKTRFFGLFIGLVALISVVSVFYPLHSLVIEKEPLGAVSLGGMESAIPPFYLSAVLFFVMVAAGLFIAHGIIEIRDLWSSKDDTVKHFLFWGLIPIPLMAVNRAVARYMLFVLVPVCLYMAHVIGRMYSERSTRALTIAVLIIHAVVFLAIGFWSNYYLQQRGLGA
ncbi:MAG: glycosyltransferase family 39 protein [Chloroflexi bacterium]|nr:glycosyltransferase family 39 protein [Chloroflexota bacterium]